MQSIFGRTDRGASRPSCTTVPSVDAALADRLAIRDVVETWANARDSRDWEAFRACWHEDGYMMATWFQGPKEDFIRVSQEGAARGVNILHFTGGVRITLAGTRAIAQTRMTIMQRGPVDGVLCDVACTGRFYDFFEKRDGRWGIVLRQPIYEKDRLDPVDPARLAHPGSRRAGPLPRGLPVPGLPAGPGRVPGQARHAGPDRPRGRAPVRSAAPPGWPASPSPPSPRRSRCRGSAGRARPRPG